MKEEFLQYIWSNALYRTTAFVTRSGKKVEILKQGELNRDAGPDFFNARIKIGGVEFAGNVEIHVKNSDWNRHEHHLDPGYRNVILSVVEDADTRIYDSSGREIETIILEYADYLYNEFLYMKEGYSFKGCRLNLENLDRDKFYLTLQYLAIERLEKKCDAIQELLDQTINDWEECFYRLICKYWSGNVNSEAFYRLSLNIPYKLILKYIDKPISVEALFFGGAGFLETETVDEYMRTLQTEFRFLQAKHKLISLPPEQWRFMRIRPTAFPTVRIALLAAFFKKFQSLVNGLLDVSDLTKAAKLMDVSASGYWDTHYNFGKESPMRKKRVGDSIINVIMINSVIPFMFMYGRVRGEESYSEKALDWLELLKAEHNHITRSWEEYGFEFDSALQTQALIQMKKVYCDPHRCMQCRVGRELLINLNR